VHHILRQLQGLPLSLRADSEGAAFLKHLRGHCRSFRAFGS